MIRVFWFSQFINDTMYPATTAGKVLLEARGMFVEDHWYWICVIALFAFSLFFNICFVGALTFLNRKIFYLSYPFISLSSLIMVLTIFLNSNAALGETKSVVAREDENNKGSLCNTKAQADRSSASTAPMFEGL